MKERNPKCSCGSTLRCLEFDNGKWWVICVGIGCSKKWLARREEDKKLPIFHETADAWHS